MLAALAAVLHPELNLACGVCDEDEEIQLRHSARQFSLQNFESSSLYVQFLQTHFL